jgi:hypothetical protein
MTAVSVAFIGTKAINGESVTTYTGGSPALNTDNVLEGSNSAGDKVSATTITTYALGAAVTGEPFNFSSGGANELDHIFMITQLQGSVDTLANGGVGIVVADDLATDSVGTWYVGPKAGYLGGWVYYVVNPARAFDVVNVAGTASWTTGGNPAQLSGVDGLGVRWKITNSIMGASDNCFLDVMSVGTGYRLTLGDAGSTEGKFSDFTTFEETSTNRYGALESKSGVLFPLCKLYIGAASGSTNTEFIDSGFTVVWQDSFVSSTFYALICEKGTGTTDVQLSNGTFKAAGTTEVYLDFAGVTNVDLTNINVERARLIDLDAACNWTGGQIVSSGMMELFGAAVLTNVKFLNGTDASQLKITNSTYFDNVDNISFTSAGTGHGIEITATGTYSFENISFTGYAGTDGSTGNECVYNNSGGAVTINVTGGTTPTIRNSGGSTTTVNANSVSATLTVTTTSGTAIQSARVLVLAAASGPFPFDVTVTISNSGTTATVTHTAHGLATNDKVQIKGASHYQNNGVFTITKIDADSYSYTMPSAPGSSPTGTIKATFAVLSGTTDVNGQITMSRVFPSDQPITGKVRKSTSAPFYKTTTLSGSVDSATGYSATVQLIGDE